MTANSDYFKKFTLLLGDILLMFATLMLSLIIRHGSNYSNELWNSHWQIFALLYLFWLPILYSFNLYNLRENVFVTSLLTNLVRATAINLVISIIYFYFISTDANISPKTILAINLTLFTLAVFLWRRFFIFLTKAYTSEKNIVVIGWDPLIDEIKHDLSSFGYKIIAVFTDQADLKTDNNLAIVNDLNLLPELIQKNKIQLIVLSGSVQQPIIEQLFLLLRLRINFLNFARFYEMIFQKIPLTIINQGWFLENISEGNKTLFEISKRIFDVLIALIIGLISLPFLPIIMLMVKFNSRGPIFFTQVRTGKDGQEFKAIKFRSMYQDSENKGPMYAQENDPRITKIGRFLRKTRIDEIPQLLNILSGEMSFIGPRPERPEFIKDLKKSIPFYQERLLVKPGLTGWAQINFPYASTDDDNLKKLQYDLYYIKNRSLILDLSILLKTLNIIFKGAGR